jgi:hypothetical protein
VDNYFLKSCTALYILGRLSPLPNQALAIPYGRPTQGISPRVSVLMSLTSSSEMLDVKSTITDSLKNEWINVTLAS